MGEIERKALLNQLIRVLRDANSWTGRTHIQKYAFLVQKLIRHRTGYDFVLYQRGPYSFELDADIRALRSKGYLEIGPMPAPYGPRYSTTSSGDQFAGELGPVSPSLESSLQSLALAISQKDAKEMELLATAYWVRDEDYAEGTEEIERLLELKPQFNRSQAKSAFAEVKKLRAEFSHL